jgi:hypothetical protein
VRYGTRISRRSPARINKMPILAGFVGTEACSRRERRLVGDDGIEPPTAPV